MLKFGLSLYSDRTFRLILSLCQNFGLSLSKITSLFGSTLFLGRTSVQRKAQKMAKSKGEVAMLTACCMCSCPPVCCMSSVCSCQLVGDVGLQRKFLSKYVLRSSAGYVRKCAEFVKVCTEIRPIHMHMPPRLRCGEDNKRKCNNCCRTEFGIPENAHSY